MLIFLYGPDTYRLSQKLREIVEEYKKRKSGDFLVFDAMLEPGGRFFETLGQNSLFQEKKFIVVKNPIEKKDFKEGLLDRMEGVIKSGHNIVFVQEGKVLKTDRLLSSFKKNAQAMEFAPLSGEKLTAWAAREFAQMGCRIDQQAVLALVQRIGNDLWRLSNEIQKIGNYFQAKEITLADIENGSEQDTETNIFETIDAIAARDKKRALFLVKEHIGRGDHPLYILAMMATQFKNLLLVKTCVERGIATGGLGIHPYVLGKVTAQSRRFKPDELKNIYGLICRADLDIKTGKIEPGAGLDLLISSI